jgi:Mg-chelatase subunit ChlD
LSVAALFPANAESADAKMAIDQIHVKMPDLRADVYVEGGGDIPDAASVTATLNNQPLKVERSASVRSADLGVKYVVLVDISGSITNAQMDEIKTELNVNFSSGLREIDEFVLITIGDTATKKLKGGESTSEIQSAIDSLDNTEGKTLLYDAINEAVDITSADSGNINKKDVIIVISDGAEYSEGGHYTKDEIEAKLSGSDAPLYAFGYDTGDRAGLDHFGELARTSGGYMRTIAVGDLGEHMGELSDRIDNSVTLYLQNDTNIVGKDKQTLKIQMSVGGADVSATKEFVARDYAADEIAPTVSGEITQIENKNGIRIEFSEPLIGAENKDAYIVRDKSGNPISVKSVSYKTEKTGAYVELIFADKLYTGEYTMAFSGITDASMEKLPLSGESKFSYKGNPAFLKILKLIFVEYWWAVFIVLLLIVAFILFRIIKKRRGLVKVDGKIGFGDMVEIKHRFEVPESALASIIVIDTKGDAKQVDVEINKSIFVGRSSINNLSFDDDKMSRQHFAIETEGDMFFVTDLGTTNGTFLNGVRLQGKRKLEDNDAITAGREKFIFRSNRK